MAGIAINSNVSSLSVQRRLAQSTGLVQESFTRLASGLRINKASDDAAGMAIAEQLGADSRVFQQGVRNLSDGISLIRIADGTFEELSGIAVRLAELAEQAGNGSLSNTQRVAQDEEAQALRQEFSRIISTTSFNDRQLLAASFGVLTLQAGYGESGQISSTLGGNAGTGSFGSPIAVGLVGRETASGDFNGDGNVDLASVAGVGLRVVLGNGDGTFSAATTYNIGSTPFSLTTADFNNDGVLDLAVALNGSTDTAVLLGDGAGGFTHTGTFTVGASPTSIVSGDFDGDGNADLATADNAGGTVSVLLGTGSGSFQSAQSFAAGNPLAITVGDFNGDGRPDIASSDGGIDSVRIFLGQGDGSFVAGSTYAVGSTPNSIASADLDNDGVLDLVTADLLGASVSVLIGSGQGTFSAAATTAVGAFASGVTIGDINSDGTNDLAVVGGGDLLVMIGAGDGTFSAPTTTTVGGSGNVVALADLNGDGALDVSKGGNVLLAQTGPGTAPLLPFSLRTQAGARQALPQFKKKLAQLAAQRGQIGAFESRLEVAMETISVRRENMDGARSRIRDSDAAEEAAKLVRGRILQQAGAAVLARANAAPALALRLLS